MRRSPELVHLPFAADFVERCAQRIVAACRAQLPDLSRCLVVLPSPALAPRLRAALAAAARRTLLLPRIATLSHLAEPGLAGAQPDALRQLLLYRQIKERGWFAEGALWEICAELLALFDELTERSVGLPGDEEALVARLAHAYALGDSVPLRFEARVVHSLWRAEASGAPSRRAAASMALARFAKGAGAPLFALCEGEPSPQEAAFFEAYGARQPVTVFVPVRGGATAPTALLNLAWPLERGNAPALATRADQARDALPESPFAGRLRLVGSAGLEEEALAVAAQVRRWLAAGKRRIALVACDRVATRRARALLERDGILVEDEAGWKLSTTRAAALVDAWLEVVAADAYHRDLLDLVKSPFVFADLSEGERQAAALQLEAGLARHNLACGLRRYERALARDADGELALRLLARIGQALGRMPVGAAPAAQWLERLEAALGELGALPALERDEAGRTLLELIRARCAELAGAGPRLAFGEWRAWLDREFERAAFVDRSIDSSVCITHLAATRLRSFDAAILIGADRDHLGPAASQAVFGSQAVRAELGLPTLAEAQARLRDDLAFLLVAADEVTATWQRLRGEEENLLCPELATLSLLHRRAWGDDLMGAAPAAEAHGAGAGGGTAMPAPAAPPQRLPLRLPVSAYASLVACPYQFFARRVLGLAEAEEVREALEKRDYGEFVHRILKRFHERHPLLADRSDEELGEALAAIAREEFAPVIAERFLDHAWQARWLARIAGYVAWARRREEAGWRWAGGELERERRLPLADGAPVCLYGRLDRLDRRADGAEAVLDYKASRRQALRERLAGDDVQLAAYALLEGEAVAEAAYVALEEERTSEVGLPEVREAAAAQEERLAATYSALRAGAGMPAHGAEAVCAWCEVRGLCRKDYQVEDLPPSPHPGEGGGSPPAGGGAAS